MAYREVDVLEAKEVLRRWLKGADKKQIAREVGLDRKTVRRYLVWAQEARQALADEAPPPPDGSSPTRPQRDAKLPDDADSEELLEALATALAKRRAKGRGRPRGDSWALCVEHKAEIERLLKTRHLGRPLTLKKAGKLLSRRKGVDIPYATLHRFAVSELGFGRKPTSVPVADGDPGKEVQIDTGWAGELDDGSGKKRRFKAWIFTAVLSRHRFVYPIRRETTREAIEACEAAWEFYGGVFEVVIPDNTKAIVDRADPLDPKFNKTFREYSQARGFFLDPTRVRRPKDKPRVERSVPHVRQDCFAGERLRDFEEARAHAIRWCRDDYGLKPHGTTRWRPRVKFEEVEQGALKAQPTTPYDMPKWTDPRVQPDQFAQVDCSLYSLPVDYVGRKLDARADSQTVRFYLRGELVKAHPRAARGERSTDKNDFPAERFATAQRDTAFYLARAQEEGEWIGKYAEALLDSPLPWSRMRQVHALLRLPKRYGAERVEEACRAALEIDLVNVARLERVVQIGGPPEAAPKPAGRVIPFPKYMRPADDYALSRDAPRTDSTNSTTTSKEGRA